MGRICAASLSQRLRITRPAHLQTGSGTTARGSLEGTPAAQASSGCPRSGAPAAPDRPASCAPSRPRHAELSGISAFQPTLAQDSRSFSRVGLKRSQQMGSAASAATAFSLSSFSSKSSDHYQFSSAPRCIGTVCTVEKAQQPENPTTLLQPIIWQGIQQDEEASMLAAN